MALTGYHLALETLVRSKPDMLKPSKHFVGQSYRFLRTFNPYRPWKERSWNTGPFFGVEALQVSTSPLLHAHCGFALVLPMTALLSFLQFRSHTPMLTMPQHQMHQITMLHVRGSFRKKRHKMRSRGGNMFQLCLQASMWLQLCITNLLCCLFRVTERKKETVTVA